MWNILFRVAAGAALTAGTVYGAGKATAYLKQRKRRKDIVKAAKEKTAQPPSAVDLPVDTNQFTKAFSVATEVKYDPQWENGTGYLDHCVYFFPDASAAHPGRIYRSIDPQQRKILILPISEKQGSVVIFERHPIESREQRPIYVFHYPKDVHPYVAELHSTLGNNDLKYLIGDVVDGGIANGIRDQFHKRVHEPN